MAVWTALGLILGFVAMAIETQVWGNLERAVGFVTAGSDDEGLSDEIQRYLQDPIPVMAGLVTLAELLIAELEYEAGCPASAILTGVGLWIGERGEGPTPSERWRAIS